MAEYLYRYQNDGTSPTQWQHTLRAELVHILKMEEIDSLTAGNTQVSGDCDTSSPVSFSAARDASYTDIDWRETFGEDGPADVRLERIAIPSVTGEAIPGYLAIPEGPALHPTMICLQGHAKEGMALSFSRSAHGGRNFALDAVGRGWAALAIEQRCFGERASDCQNTALRVLHEGQTLTGLRINDLQRALECIDSRDDLDARRIGCMGNSMGGTVCFYAACIDERIRLAVVSCSFCTYARSWLKHRHCACGYLPGIGEIADMGDLGGLIAPRDLLIVAGRHDEIADIDGVSQAYENTRTIYSAFGVNERVKLLPGDRGHEFYPELAWPEIERIRASWDSIS